MRKIFSFFSFSLIILGVVIPLLSILTYYDFEKELLFSKYILSIGIFTIFQSILSAFLTIILGVIFAYLLVKHNYIHGINIVTNSLSIIFVLPTIISVMGIITFYGDIISIYGLHGILLAHVLLNVPLVTRVLVQSLNDISPNEKSLARQMGLSHTGIFFSSEWPIIKKNIPSLFVLIAFICFVSFIPILILGGGPKYSTIEVAIYQSVIFLNDFNQATVLLMMQIFSCGLIFIFFFKSFKSNNFILNDQRKSLNYNSYSYKYLLLR